MLFIFPTDPLNPRLVDEEFRPEAQALRSLGHEVLRVNTDALERETGEAILPWPSRDEEEAAVYRGWMLTPDLYASMALRLESKNVVLRTSPAQYRQSHELPGWVNEMREYTAKTVELAATDLAHTGECLEALAHGKVFLRDYSKSLKHNPEACVIEAGASAPEALRTVQLFEDLRGEHLAGRVLMREFESFSGPEVRTWWVNGTYRTATSHPDTPDSLPAFAAAQLDAWLPPGFADALRSLDLPFVTCDFTLREDGVVRLVEIGDGQVSGVPTGLDLDAFVSEVLA